jgi:hypothetical protein
MSRIIGYTYEADVHCPDCTSGRFAGAEDGQPLDPQVPVDSDGYALDREGNQVRPVFSWDSDCARDHCGDCGAPLVDHDCADHAQDEGWGR